ncbi:hypothetical protein PMIN03_005897 [Paraphaeosphaeria minitans]
MDVPPETFPSPSASIRRDTVSTMSSDKLPSLPSGRWPITIHGNCARCGHHHKAATIQIHVVEGICEASHVVCDRCGQKWLTIGGLNSTQISLLSTVTTELDYGEINFRYTLFSMVRSATSIASPTALANVPEDPSPLPSRSSSARYTRHFFDASKRSLREYRANASSDGYAEARPTQVLDSEPIAEKSMPSLPNNSSPALKRIKRKLKKVFGVLKKVHHKALSHKSRRSEPTAESDGKEPNTETEMQRQTTSTGIVVPVSPGNKKPFRHVGGGDSVPAKITGQAIEDLGSVDKGTIRNMTPKQRDTWVRGRITAYKQSKSRSALQCDCKRRHSASSIGDYSLLPHRSATTPIFQRYSLDQMGSQFDALPPGAFFNHTGPLTISATRISEADTAVEHQEDFSSPQTSQHARPASLFRSRLSWQQSRHARTQRDSLDFVLANPIRHLRGLDRLSLASVTSQDILTEVDARELPSSANPVVEGVSTTSHRSES